MPMNPDTKKLYNQNYYRKKVEKAPNAPQTVQHSDRKVLFSVRLPASLVGRMHRIMIEAQRDGVFMWKNQSHLAADLLVRGLETVKGVEVIDEALQYLRAVSATDSIGSHRREAQAAFARVKTELRELQTIKATDQARHYYHATIKEFQKMSSNVWRDWFLAEMRKTFPELHKSAPGKIHLGGDILDHRPVRVPTVPKLVPMPTAKPSRRVK